MESKSEHLKVAVRIRPLLEIDKSEEVSTTIEGV
jgi:hypothetical protein